MAAGVLRILALCIAAALICISLRASHPQIASAVALATGIAALMLSTKDLESFSKVIETLDKYAGSMDGEQIGVLRLCGIAMIAEFASDICRDAGETALARRIDFGVKIGVAASALPAAGEIMARISELLS